MIKINNTNIWSIIHSIVLLSLKIVLIVQIALLFGSIHKRLNEFYKNFGWFENFSPQTKEKGNLKEKVLSDAGGLFNELYYIYKDKYNKEKNGPNSKDTNKFDYKKLILTGDNQYESEEEEEKEKTSKKLDKKNHLKNLIKKNHLKNLIKKNHLKNQQKVIWDKLMNWLIKKKKA